VALLLRRDHPQVTDPSAPEIERLYRRRSGRTIAGIAGGLADHLGVDVLWVRLAFAAAAVAAGAGVVAYGLLWIFVPQQDPEAEAKPVSSREQQQAIALIALGLGVALATGTLTGTFSGWAGLALALTVVGGAIVWREADEAQRRRSKDGRMFAGAGGNTIVRVLSGVALVITGVAGFLLKAGGEWSNGQFVIITVVAVLIGVAVVTVPWWLRLVRDLTEERRKRIRTEERAEIAAHLHDSVLQTLALIQKQADAPREVLRLARGQERQLRTWLYGPAGYGRDEGTQQVSGPSLLSEAIEIACGEVEDTFAIKVQQVVVGDVELDEKLMALVQATREAAVNAAKHAGVAEVSVYAEVEPDRVNIFVRDRGKGFDPGTVSEDRHGLADSIRGRMDRNGGTVRLRTAPGEGTEVHLEIPRSTAAAARADR
jgi:signal transduction histidine kinase